MKRRNVNVFTCFLKEIINTIRMNLCSINPTPTYLFKVSNRGTRKRREIGSKLVIETSERRQWRRSDVFINNFEHVPHLFQVFL